MTDVIITLTLDEAKILLNSAERDFNEYRVDRERVVLDRLATKIEEAEKEQSAYNLASTGEVHLPGEQLYQGPSRYAHPTGASPRTIEQPHEPRVGDAPSEGSER